MKAEVGGSIHRSSATNPIVRTNQARISQPQKRSVRDAMDLDDNRYLLAGEERQSRKKAEKARNGRFTSAGRRH